MKRLWNLASWVVIAVAVMLAIIAWSPSLRLRFGSTTKATDRGRAVDFTMPTLDGGRFTLSEHRGQVVLVNLWATWCPPCRMETPDLVSLQSDYARRGLQVVGISLDEDQARIGPFVQRYRINYPVLLPGSSSFPLADGVDALPTSILLDRDGRVARRYVGMISAAAVRGDIDKLLAEAKGH